MPCLTFGLIESPQVNDDSCQQIVGRGICWREFFCPLELSEAFSKFPIYEAPSEAEGCTRLGQGRRDRNGLFRIASRFWVRGRPLPGEIANKNPRLGTFCVS